MKDKKVKYMYILLLFFTHVDMKKGGCLSSPNIAIYLFLSSVQSISTFIDITLSHSWFSQQSTSGPVLNNLFYHESYSLTQIILIYHSLLFLTKPTCLGLYDSLFPTQLSTKLLLLLSSILSNTLSPNGINFC